MNPEAQRIAVAEACGWKIADRVHPDIKLQAYLCWIRPGNEEWQEEELPDYLNDLNAMHDAVTSLDQSQKNYFVNILDDLIETEKQPERDFAWCNATAAQRAEAFLRTLNLWKE